MNHPPYISTTDSSPATGYKEYGYRDVRPTQMHRLFLPPLLALSEPLPPGTRVLDVGCGNGYTANEFLRRGCSVVGIDLSLQGIELARGAYPEARFEVLSADGNILQNLGCEPFDVIVSTEVVEHLYDPRAYASGCFYALRPGGRLICSTPYHGYFKNLALALFNRYDKHADPLWDGGHIKLWSRRTLARLMVETGFENLRFRGVGRFPFLWMTMLMSGRRPL